MPPGNDARIPVIVLTGFLGSGKTTILRHVLRHPAFSDAAVLINEFGEVGLDHVLVGALDREPVLLASGCICCTIRGDLSRAVRDLHDRRQRGEIPRFRRLIIETTGLADPAPILSTIAADPVIRHHFAVGVIVAAVDAVHAEAGFKRYPQMLRQVAAADRLIVTKSDLALEGTTPRLLTRLSALNPQADIAQALHGAIDPDLLQPDDATTPRRWIAQSAEDDPSTSHGGIRSFCLSSADPVPWSAFGLWLSLLVHRHGGRLLRVKGLLDVAGSTSPVAIHALQHVIHPPEHLPDWPSDDRQSRIVFIVEDLDPDLVRRSFTSFMRLSTPASQVQATVAS